MNTLIIFLKYPEAGKVKTRLAKDIGAEKAARIYSNMAKQIVDKVSNSGNYNTVIYYDPPEKKNEIAKWLEGKGFHFSQQTGDTLGRRISSAFSEVFDQGAERAVIIGTDCIDITPDIINQTLDLLNLNDLILGPADDGGYYLLGLKKYIPGIFEKIDWSTERVLNQTIENIKQLGLEYDLLTSLRDIDDVYDLKDQMKNLT